MDMGNVRLFFSFFFFFFISSVLDIYLQHASADRATLWNGVDSYASSAEGPIFSLGVES